MDRQGRSVADRRAYEQATIFAPATVVGRAAVGIVRCSGSAVADICFRLTNRELPPPRRATLREIHDDDGRAIDRAMLLYFAAPASFTGEDILEIHHHGGPAIVRALLDLLIAMPACRPAEAGEFTRRAFMGGKVDLTEAEAVGDLIDATSVAQLRQAAGQLQGALSRRLVRWSAELTHCLALVEAEIDFSADDDVPEGATVALRPRIEELIEAFDAMLVHSVAAERLRIGLTVAVTGAPNVGKSSLVNLLAGRDVAIVTATPGTTRDVIEVALDLEGLPVTLLDTAGLRESDDPIEREGVRRARLRAAEADIVLIVVDRAEDLPAAPEENSIVVQNKCDGGGDPTAGHVQISCLNGQGIDYLLRQLHERARTLVAGSGETALTRLRHRAALDAAKSHLVAFLADLYGASLDRLAEDLRLALRSLGRITGHVEADRVLDEIFSTFCIGK
ncbi:MAG: tRNA uridine-5-carboxymethylaminomethyl(34) synthesis GTPase MnmE [Geminicoccaceae bacterium]|nr:tRNA uridine-5-carboxymethylaminomethyl(34) synthesis GTPase MnmE [Geminicoccaceae bacterium]